MIRRMLASIAACLLATPATARFLQADPMGYGPDPNLYIYVGNDPTDKTDPEGLYQYTCETGSRIGCAEGFQTLQQKAIIRYQNAIDKLGNAIADLRSVAAQQAAGNASAAVSSETAQTEAQFTHAFGAQNNMLGAMRGVQSALQAGLAGLQGNGVAANASGSDLVDLTRASAPAGSHSMAHSILLNPPIFNSIDQRRATWALGHEPLHAEVGWHDAVDSTGRKYMRWDTGSRSPLELTGPAALSNPDNAMCFVMGGC